MLPALVKKNPLLISGSSGWLNRPVVTDSPHFRTNLTLVGFFFVGFPPWGGGLTMLVKFVMVKCRLVKKTQKIRLFSKLCLESVALWSVSAPGFFSRVSPDR